MSEQHPEAAIVAPSLVLVGAPGSGKSTIGSILARMLGLDFIDVDAHIERQQGKPISDIFVDDGEPRFRQLEREATLELLGSPGVISLGGGAVTNPEIRAALTSHQVVWLTVSAAQAARRVGMNKQRPLLLGNVRSRLVQMMAERNPLYAEVATITVDSDSGRPNAVARSVLEALGVDPDA